MTLGLDDNDLKLAFSRYSVNFQSGHPSQLLILDCETQRFTIEEPSSMEIFYQWCYEVDHAVAAGRHIVCVPVSGSSIEEIQGIGTGLGYVYWPSKTILALPVANPSDNQALLTGGTGTLAHEESERRLRLLARVGII
jgi:hypothetical protein